jgi:amidase
MRRSAIAVLILSAIAVIAPSQSLQTDRSAGKQFDVVESTIPQMRAALEEGRTTSREIVVQYLTRIATYEDKLNAVITVNPKALAEAEERDRERTQGKIRGPLHGIPIALKDNIHTTDMPTTGGALVFDRMVPPYEATLTRNLKDAGAIIIAKTGMTELANWVASGMPGNYNALTGYGMNPYDPRRDPRQATGDGRPVLGTGGSSSGIGTAANFWAANVGTETSGSILSPANQNMLVGIKPTVGRVSRYGVIHSRPGYAGTNGPDSDGRRHSARCSGRRDTRCQRLSHQDLCATSQRRLHALPQLCRAQRRAHRHSESLLL